MSRRAKWVTQGLILFTLVATSHAQQPPITVETGASTGLLREWLESRDPRLIAWSATLAARHHDQAIIVEMPILLEHWTIPYWTGDTLDQAQREQRRAAQTTVGSLIQRGLIQQGNPPQLRVTLRCDIKPCPLAPAPTPATGFEMFMPR